MTGLQVVSELSTHFRAECLLEASRRLAGGVGYWVLSPSFGALLGAFRGLHVVSSASYRVGRNSVRSAE
jgi:hypothetical protein